MVDMASDKNEASGADESLPCIIYVILKALPSRMYSTLQLRFCFIKYIILKKLY